MSAGDASSSSVGALERGAWGSVSLLDHISAQTLESGNGPPGGIPCREGSGKSKHEKL